MTLKDIILSERSQSQDKYCIWFHLYEVLKNHKDKKYNSSCHEQKECSYCLMGKISVLQDEKTYGDGWVVMTAQKCECIQYHWTVHWKMVKIMSCYAYFNTIKKKKKTKIN